MLDSNESPENYCMDLHNLISITLDDLIQPMRRLIKSQSMLSIILETEIQDAENKTFEYIAQQISVICKANEAVANQILRQFPRSETCFQCLGIDEYTIQGLLRIRGIGFLELLDMPDESVVKILKHYRDHDSSIERVLSGIAKIRGNMELIEKDASFEDDTRNLISLMQNTLNSNSSEELNNIETLKQQLINERQRYSNPEDYKHINNEQIDSLTNHNITYDKRSNFPLLKLKPVNSRFFNGGLTVPIKSPVYDATPPNSPFTKRVNNYLKIPLTPTVKQKFKVNFNLHRSKSHESNLGNKVITSNANNRNTKTETQNGAIVSGCNQFSEIISPDIFVKNDVFSFRDILNENLKTILSNHARRASLESITSNNNKIPPVSGSVEAEDQISTRHSNDCPNATFIQTISGSIHKFELESKLGNLVRGIQCAACNTRINVKFQHCVYCKVKVHKHCVQESYRLKCIRQTSSRNNELSKGYLGSKHLIASNLINNNIRPAHSTPTFQASDSNSAASSSYNGSTPGSPYPVNLPNQNHCVTLNNSQNVPLRCGNSSSDGSSSGGGNPPISPSFLLSSGTTCIPQSPISKITNQYYFGATSEHDFNNTTTNICQDQLNLTTTIPSITSKTSNVATVKETNNPQTHVNILSSEESDRTFMEGSFHRFESVDSQDDTSSFNRTNSLSKTLQEWDIPLENVIIHKLIGRGTFGMVYSGHWHGEVAVKKLDFAAYKEAEDDNKTETARVAAFRREVDLLHKSRHGHLCLFMGACMKPPNFAIVTSFSKGETLYFQLHQRKVSMIGNRAINIASQIANGMGYLHAKGILHKDLKTRNIFIEQNSRALISDYGLFNFVRLCRNRVPRSGSAYLNVPPQWFCSAAPEILRTLNIHHAKANEATELPFTINSDIYAFGTIWYELLTNELPYKGLSSETIMLLSCKGVKQPMRIPGPKDFKEFLNQCWSYKPERRPPFTSIVKILDRMPKLHRCPSYPAKPITTMINSSHDDT